MRSSATKGKSIADVADATSKHEDPASPAANAATCTANAAQSNHAMRPLLDFGNACSRHLCLHFVFSLFVFKSSQSSESSHSDQMSHQSNDDSFEHQSSNTRSGHLTCLQMS